MPYSNEELKQAVERLSDPERFGEAERVVSEVAPDLQAVLVTALGAGGRPLALTIAAVAARLGEPTVVLTGGCFQNARLTEAAVAALRDEMRLLDLDSQRRDAD